MSNSPTAAATARQAGDRGPSRTPGPPLRLSLPPSLFPPFRALGGLGLPPAVILQFEVEINF